MELFSQSGSFWLAASCAFLLLQSIRWLLHINLKERGNKRMVRIFSFGRVGE